MFGQFVGRIVGQVFDQILGQGLGEGKTINTVSSTTRPLGKQFEIKQQERQKTLKRYDFKQLKHHFLSPFKKIQNPSPKITP